MVLLFLKDLDKQVAEATGVRKEGGEDEQGNLRMGKVIRKCAKPTKTAPHSTSCQTKPGRATVCKPGTALEKETQEVGRGVP